MTLIVSGIVDRASWLAYRADWRAAYKAASQEVRNVKEGMRDVVRARRSGAIDARVADDSMSMRQYDRHIARETARDLMDDLDEAKKRRDALRAAGDATAQAVAA